MPGVPERLVDRHPRLTASELAARFVPPPRFTGVRFATFSPNPNHPSQAAARHELEALAHRLAGASPAAGGGGGRWFRRRAAGPAGPRGRYLDGGFGVGKTHLLASTWHAVDGSKAFLTFEELTAFIGFVGMGDATAAFGEHRLLCVDEFELDDVANTRMAVSFLRAAVAAGTTVVTTSNAVPDRLGEGRFNAEDFQREIGEIGSHFEVVRIDGPDFRAASHPPDVAALSPGEVEALAGSGGVVTVDELDAVLAHLRTVHPVHYGALLDGLDGVVISGLHPIDNQGAALLFVQLVDEIYDAGIRFGATGCRVGELFPPAYRGGGYRKKYGRCESRLGAMLSEARGIEA